MTDTGLPDPGSTLGEWSWFILQNIPTDFPAWGYIDWLTRTFGPDYIVEQDPETFWDHIVRAPHSEMREAA